MNLTTKEIKAAARAALRGNYAKASFAWIVPSLIILAVTIAIMLAAPGGIDSAKVLTGAQQASSEEFMRVYVSFTNAESILSVLFSFLSVGGSAMFFAIKRREECRYKKMFSYFSFWLHAAVIAVITGAASSVFSLLASAASEALPSAEGTFLALSFAATFYVTLKLMFAQYILIDDKPKNVISAVVESWKMTDVRVLSKLLWLLLSFIGWAFLTMITLGAAVFYVAPYINMSLAVLYDEVRNGKNAADSFTDNNN